MIEIHDFLELDTKAIQYKDLKWNRRVSRALPFRAAACSQKVDYWYKGRRRERGSRRNTLLGKSSRFESSKYLKMFRNPLNGFEIFQIVSKSVKLFRNPSKCFKILHFRKKFRNFETFRNFFETFQKTGFLRILVIVQNIWAM